MVNYGNGGTYYQATGLAGATMASRYAGATSSGAPVSGSFLVGDFIVDRTGGFWVCTSAGSPGTWVRLGQLDTTAADIAAVGIAPAAGSSTKAAAADHVHADPNPVPAVNAALAWTYDPGYGDATQSALGTAGTVYFVLFYNPVVQTLTNLSLYVGTAGGTLTTGQCFAGLYSISGGTATLQATTADQTANWGGTGLKTAAFTVAYASAPVGWYGIGAFFNGTTGPAFKGAGAPASLLNFGQSGAGLRCAVTNSTGNTTAMPATIAISSNVSGGSVSFWAGLT